MLLCVALAAAAGYALFTDDGIIRNHLQAGSLDISLKRVLLEKRTLDDKGYLFDAEPDTTVVDFSRETKENIFGIAKGEWIIPGSKFSATLELENIGNVDFGYFLNVVCNHETSGEYLARQVKITVISDKFSAFVADGLSVRGEENEYIDIVRVGDKATFTVTIEFLDSDIPENEIEDNNLAKNQTLDFDLIVTAVQLIDKSPNSP